MVRFLFFLIVLCIITPLVSAQDKSDTVRLRALTGVERNSEWQPFVQTFHGVEMLLVPAGCFLMGNEQGLPNEMPVHEQCFSQPFWIDRAEVSNEQFQSFNGRAGRDSFWTTPPQPRESITWLEASDYCKRRGGRLPTEAEWEFAARGPDNLIYPWGDTFEADLTVYNQNSKDQTRDVAQHLEGMSWVGALNMNGNVYEWVSTIFVEAYGMWIYPYNATDGRENDLDMLFNRVFRGGSWASDITTNSHRETQSPQYYTFTIGFRCVRDYRSTDLE